jgi:hypothetical protein
MPPPSIGGCVIAHRRRRSPVDHTGGSRCFMSVTRPFTRRRRNGRTDSSRSLDDSASLARIPTPSITGTGIQSSRGPHCGGRSAPSGTCHWRRYCSRPARTRRTASPRTSRRASETSKPSTCCTAIT